MEEQELDVAGRCEAGYVVVEEFVDYFEVPGAWLVQTGTCNGIE